MMRYLWLLLLIPVAACSYTTYLTDADEKGGTVNLVTEFSHDSAVAKANAHCHTYHRVAQVIRTDPASNTLMFSCVPPDPQ
jgi:hypothetical protein